MKTNVSRKTINTYIYLKNHVINTKSADKQVHMMKASNNKNLFKSYCGFLCIFFLFIKMKGLEMVKCESLRMNMYRITHTGKSMNFPVTLACSSEHISFFQKPCLSSLCWNLIFQTNFVFFGIFLDLLKYQLIFM